MTMPGLWEFGTADDRTPVEQSIAILDRLKATGNSVTILVFPNAGHGLLDVPPTDPKAPPAMIKWIVDQVHPPAR
jgi:dipeptidyl aminopeptidase/acylaminoacyl peptidase